MSETTPVNRKVIRQALVAGITPALTLAQKVYGYQRSKLDGMATVTRIFGASVERPRMGVGDVPYGTSFSFIIQNMVLHATQTGQAFTEAAAEDMLDDMEHQVASWVYNNARYSEPHWQIVAYDRTSVIGTFKAGGNELYLVEDLYIVVDPYVQPEI